jgi:hypothetical protein
MRFQRRAPPAATVRTDASQLPLCMRAIKLHRVCTARRRYFGSDQVVVKARHASSCGNPSDARVQAVTVLTSGSLLVRTA